jgi:hypothetical protein
MTAGPFAGPASAYPTFRTPALICFSGPNDVFVPGLKAGEPGGSALLDCARADPIIPNWAAAIANAAEFMKPRRRVSILSVISMSPTEVGVSRRIPAHLFL